MLVVALVLVALSAENVTALYGGCVMVSVLVHYFTLVAVLWMGAEALLMFQKLVIIFTRITTKFIVFVSIICWSKSAYMNSKKNNNNISLPHISMLCVAVPVVLVLVPLIVDLATGSDPVDDIVIQRANVTTEGISL